MSGRTSQTSSSTVPRTALGMRSSLSRVNSLTRSWGDDDSLSKDKHKGAALRKGANLIEESDEDEEVQWTPSPD